MEGIINNSICDETKRYRGKGKLTKDLEQKRINANIGEECQICKYCDAVRLITDFRKNRKKCIFCERESDKKYYTKEYREKKKIYKNNRIKTDPVYKFIICQRRRIYNCIKKKQKKTIQLLGCNSQEYFNWLQYNFNDSINFENHGTFWHIDHVIPISTFNFENEDEQLLAFNWRNTTPLSAKENSSKNNRLVSSQIEEHFKKLISYHKEKDIEMPKEFIDLFARFLVAGNP